MAYFAHAYLRAYTKTIRHFKSTKKSFAEWTHPDMVGCYFPIEDWEPDVFGFSELVGHAGVRLYSFELKKELSFGNLREAYFQAVSNSSWANEGFLVAAKVSTDDEFRSELRRLTTAFHIGVIELNVNSPDDSEVIYPATTKDAIDWETMNKLATLNSDFSTFLKRIRIDLQSREVVREKYDDVLDIEEIDKLFAKEQSAFE